MCDKFWTKFIIFSIMSSLVQIYDFPRPVLVFPLFPRGGCRLIWACDEGCCDIQLLCWDFALGVEWVSPVLDSVSVHVVVGLWPLSSLHSPGSAHASLTHATVLFCISTVHCLRLTAERNAFEFISVDSLQFSSFLADHHVDVVTYFRHLKHFLLPLVLDLVSAFGLILQQYSLTSADGIQRDVLIKTRLPFHRFVLHPSSCLSVCEVQVSAVMQDPVWAGCQGFRVQHDVNDYAVFCWTILSVHCPVACRVLSLISQYDTCCTVQKLQQTQSCVPDQNGYAGEPCISETIPLPGR